MVTEIIPKQGPNRSPKGCYATLQTITAYPSYLMYHFLIKLFQAWVHTGLVLTLPPAAGINQEGTMLIGVKENPRTQKKNLNLPSDWDGDHTRGALPQCESLRQWLLQLSLYSQEQLVGHSTFNQPRFVGTSPYNQESVGCKQYQDGWLAGPVLPPTLSSLPSVFTHSSCNK